MSVPVFWGAVFWLVVCVAAVLIRGVRWEETLDRAQVLIGQVQYPAWHPFYRYAHNAFTIQYYVSAAILWLHPSGALVCGLRDVVCLAATVMPVYLLTALVARRALHAHAAVVLALSGVLVAFGSYYPLFVWPEKFTSGHIGMAAALLTLYLIVSGRTGLGFCLAGLMPVIHIGQAPVLLAVAGLYTAWSWFDAPDARPRLIRSILWGVAGFAVSAAVWLVIYANRVPPPMTGPFAGDAAMTFELWKAYMFGEDIHRAFARFNPIAHGYIALGIAVFLGLFTTGTLRERIRRPETWLGIYAAIAGILVVSIGVTEHILGPDTPAVLVIWMPNRLLNHAAVLALVLAAGVPANSTFRVGSAQWPFAVALGWLALMPLSALVLPEHVHARYVAAPEGVLFLLAGAAAAVMAKKPSQPSQESSEKQGQTRFQTAEIALRRSESVPVFRGPACYLGLWAALCGGLAAVGFFHQFGALLMLVGFVLAWVGGRCGLRHRAYTCLLASLCVLVLGMELFEQGRTRRTLPITPFESSVADYLRAHSAPDQFLVTPHWEIDWQEKTDRPVLYTYELPQFITYMPDLAPATIKIRADIYDMHLGLPWDYELAAWRTRSGDEWRRLATEYNFAHVLSPKHVPLDLKPVLAGEAYDLYAVE